MPNEKNHLYTMEDERRDRKNIDKKKDQQQFSRFSVAESTSNNNANIKSTSPALQIESKVQIGDPYDDTKGSVGASTQSVFFDVYGSNYTFYEVTGDVAFVFNGLPTGRHILFTLDITVNQVAGVALTFPQVTNPPTLAGNDGDHYVLQFIGVLRSDPTGANPPVATYTFLTGATAGGIGYPIIWPSVTQAPAIGALANVDFSLNTGNANIIQFPAGNVQLGFILPPAGAFAEETHLMVIQDGVGGRIFSAVPAALKNGGLLNGLIDPLPNAKTMFKIVTHDNGVTYHAELVDLAAGAGGIVPNGTAQYQHLEWNGAAWIAQQFLEFGANSAFQGEIRFPNDVIGIAWSNQAHTGDVQLKVDSIFNYLDVTNSANGTVGLMLRAQHASDPDQTLTIFQTPGTIGTATISTENELDLDIGGFPKVRLIGADIIQLFDNVDDSGFFRAASNVINLGEINAIVYETFGAPSGNTGKSISRFATGLHYDLEDNTHTHLFRIGGATPADVLEITEAELIVYSPLDVIPESDGVQDLGVDGNSWNDINVDRIILRHNNGILATFPSIGRSSNALILNSPTGNPVNVQINGVLEYFFDNLKFAIKNLNNISFLDAGDVADARIEYLDPLFRLVSPSMELDMTDVTGGLVIYNSANQTATTLAGQVLFNAKNSSSAKKQYGFIKGRINSPTAGAEKGEVEFGVTQGAGLETETYFELNGLLEQVRMLKEVSMNSNDIVSIGTGTITNLTEEFVPTTGDFILVYEATSNAMRKVDIGNLPSGGGSVSFPIEPVITDFGDTWTGTQTLNLATGDGHTYKWTVDQNLTFAATVTNRPPSGTQRTFELEFVHDGIGGTFTVTLPNNFTNENGQTLNSFTISSGNTVILTARINDGTNFLVVQTNVTATSSSGANVSLSNLSGVSINTSLVSDSNITDDLGTGALAWHNIFVENVRLSATGVGIGGANQIYADAGGVVLNFPASQKLTIQENTVTKWDFSASTLTGGNIILTDTLTINDSSNATPAIGQFSRSGNDIFVQTSSGIKNLDDIGSGGGGGATVALDNLVAVAINADLDPEVASHGLLDLGNASASWNDLHVDRILFQHNDGISATTASIGRSSTALRLNTPASNPLTLEVGGVAWLTVDGANNRIEILSNLASGLRWNSTGNFMSIVKVGLGKGTLTSQDGFRFDNLTEVEFSNGVIFTAAGGGIDMNANNITDVNNITSTSSGNITGFAQIDISDALRYSNDNDMQIAFTSGGIFILAPSTNDNITIIPDGSLFLGPNGNEITIQPDAIQIGAAGTDTLAIVARIISNVIIDNGAVIKSNDATEIGFQVTNGSLTVGTEGSIIIPGLNASVPATKAAVDADFGNLPFAMGAYINTSLNTAVLVIRQPNGNWAGVSMVYDLVT